MAGGKTVVQRPGQHRSVRRPGGFHIRPAKPDEAGAVAACVKAAYRLYAERIGKEPGTMQEDYAQVLRARQVMVALIDQAIVGVLVMAVTDEGFLLENVAVVPACQGQGIGRALLELAESTAAQQGFGSIYLLAPQDMHESLALLAKVGYVEYERRGEQALAQVCLRKRF